MDCGDADHPIGRDNIPCTKVTYDKYDPDNMNYVDATFSACHFSNDDCFFYPAYATENPNGVILQELHDMEYMVEPRVRKHWQDLYVVRTTS